MTRVAVTSRSFSKHPVLRAELLQRYDHVTFNDDGLELRGAALIDYLTGHDKAITAETVSEFRKFRVEIAHDVQYYDAARGVSLARKVCSELAYNEVAASQVDQFAVLKTYAGMQDRLWPQGVLLCIIALLVWTFTIVGQILKTGMRSSLYALLCLS